MATLKRILHIEDEADIAEIARITLEELGGYVVETCISGEEAIEKAAAIAPDLILLDAMMPGIDGPATLRELRKITQTAQTPVIFVTAKAQKQELETLMALGAIGVIPKPFDPMSLVNEIQHIWASAAHCG